MTTERDAAAQAFFTRSGDGPASRRYGLWHAPADGVARGLIVHVPPFGEEMNKSRRMTALTARALAAAGWAVLRMDLLGCGDSEGDLNDATWPQWCDDVAHACRTADARAAAAWGAAADRLPRWLWGHRAGCLLAAVAAPAVPSWGRRMLFWQPQAAGKQVVQQFLRLKLAAASSAADAKAVGEQMRRALAAGHAVDVAGYRLPAALASALEVATLAPPGEAGHAVWIETQARDGASLLPATASAWQQWSAAGWQGQSTVVQGPAFWMSVEIEEAPALIQATVAALDGDGA